MLWVILFVSFSCTLTGQDTLIRKELRKQQKSYLIPGKNWTLELPLWIPGYTGSLSYGDIRLEGEDGDDIQNPIEPLPPPGFGDIFKRIFTTDWYLKFFFLTRVSYQKKWFLGQLDGLTGAVGESTEFNYNQKEVVQVNFRTINMRMFGGVKLIEANGRKGHFRYDLFAYIGLRAHFHRINSDLNGVVNRLNINPSWIEPIVGLYNSFAWRRWLITLQGDYGGYFVDGKRSFQINGTVFFRSGRITSLKAGWNHLSISQEGQFLREEYRLRAIFSGPTVGLAFHF